MLRRIPLLKVTPDLLPSIPNLKFSKTPQQYLENLTTTIRNAQENLQKISKTPKNSANFKTVLKPIADLEASFRVSTMVHSFLQYVSEDADLRKAGAEATKQLDEYEIEKGMDEGVYEAVRGAEAAGEPLEGEERRFLEKVLLAYRRNGLGLAQPARDELKAMKKRLAELQNHYQQNLNEEDTKVAFSPADLEGVGADLLAGLEQKDGLFLVSMKYPEYNGVMRMAHKRATRERMYAAFQSRCPQNVALLAEAVRLRHQCARLLGYPSHAEFQLQERLARSSKTVMEFEDALRRKLIPLAEREIVKLVGLKRRHLGLSETASVGFDSIDFAYYNRMLTVEEYNVDFEKVKEYFSLESVVPEMLKIYQEVLGLQFVELEEAPVWHEQVQAFRATDSQSGELVGHFYMDLFPRQGKYSHAACFPLQPGYLMDEQTGQRSKPAVAIVANFSKPGPDQPSLLRFDEVVTLFHELGHAMHGLCACTKFSRFHGTKVETDFVEVPSQMLENWVWSEGTLERLSAHYKTGEKIPKELMEKIIATRRINAGLLNLRQIFFGIFDMTLHAGDPGELEGDLNEIYRRLKKEISLFEDPDGLCPSGSFGHLMGGYSAGYYSYLWSEVLASDMFASRFEKEGLQNALTGREYRREILQPGGSRDGMESFRAFLGREPNQEAFLRSIGIN